MGTFNNRDLHEEHSAQHVHGRVQFLIQLLWSIPELLETSYTPLRSAMILTVLALSFYKNDVVTRLTYFFSNLITIKELCRKWTIFFYIRFDFLKVFSIPISNLKSFLKKCQDHSLSRLNEAVGIADMFNLTKTNYLKTGFWFPPYFNKTDSLIHLFILKLNPVSRSKLSLVSIIKRVHISLYHYLICI